MAEFRSAEERLARVRETVQGFQGTRSESRTARRRGLSRGQNLLLGAALHAASRLEQGLEATALEAGLLEVLRAGAVNDEEIAAWGRVFAEQRASRGGVQVFPAAINALDVKSGYDFEEFRADLAAVAAEIVAQPNVEVVDVTRLELDGPKESEEFLEALGRYGTGVTVLTGARPEVGTERAAPAAFAAPMVLSLKAERFECERRSGEVGHDEIYWAMAAGTDTEAQSSAKTPEFGSIVKGSHRYFTGDHAVQLTNGTVRGYVSLNIECWEADDSSGGFYNKMREVLRTMSKRLADASQEQHYSPPDREFNAEGWAALLAVLGELINALLGWLTNDDDLVCERSIGLSHSALTHYFTGNREESWLFDGGHGGRHRLWLRGNAQRFPLTARYRRHDGSGWYPEARVPGQIYAGTPPTGCSFEGSPHVFYTHSSTGQLYWTRSPALPPSPVRGIDSPLPAAVTEHDGALYCVHVGFDQAVYWNRWTPADGWSAPVAIHDWRVPASPALVSFKGTLYCSVIGLDGRVCWSKFTGATWTSATHVSNWQTPRGVSLTVHGDRLYMAHLAMTGALWLSYTDDGTNWHPPQNLPEWTSVDSPAVGSAGGNLHFAWRTVSGVLRLSTHNGTAWSHTDLQPDGYGPPALISSPAPLHALYL
ncbi:hypothetical protein [Streptomyces violascens]|uniref:hypothetical protein n=1 Tax=Streptomyces violascens TaxID=67381 RepID=UPI00167B948E|nr:hypothetical protein [Streptomyces violascens]GGU47112.1 hypothetical protein GCM10010289_79490 [Streptomyces violascens]